MKTVLLGCGAQKAGTTWLAINLSRSPQYWNGGIKEWRFWKYYFDSNSRLLQLRNLEEKLQKTHAPDKRLDNKKLKWRMSALQSPDSFLQHISDKFNTKVNVKVLGDMSPSNGTLGIDEFYYIKKYFNGRGVIVKPLLIMRDPFERIWSKVRMTIGNRYPEEYQKNEQFITKTILDTYRLKEVEKRTRYEHIIEKLEHVFDPENICYEFTEQLFSQEGLDKVTNHLGISKITVDIESPNSSPKLIAIPDEIKREIVTFYKDTYLSVHDKFGDNVKNLWSESFKLL